MGKRKRKRQQGQKRKASPKIEKKKMRLRPYMIIAVILLLAGGGVYAWWYTTQQETSSEASARESKQSSGLPATPRVPRPATLAPAEFSGKTVRAYRIASNVPELIEQMPCYCDCYRGNGHQNNLDCYVDKHAAT